MKSVRTVGFNGKCIAGKAYTIVFSFHPEYTKRKEPFSIYNQEHR